MRIAMDEAVRATPGTRATRSSTSCSLVASRATSRSCMSLAPVTVCMSTISGTASASAVATSSCPTF